MEGSAEHFEADIKDLEVRLTRLIYAVGVSLGLEIIANIGTNLAKDRDIRRLNRDKSPSPAAAPSDEIA